MKLDLRTPQQRLEEKLTEIENKLDRVLEILEAKGTVETVEKKIKKVSEQNQNSEKKK